MANTINLIFVPLSGFYNILKWLHHSY